MIFSFQFTICKHYLITENNIAFPMLRSTVYEVVARANMNCNILKKYKQDISNTRKGPKSDPVFFTVNMSNLYRKC